MRSLGRWGLVPIVLLCLALSASAGDGEVRYEFDHVEVDYAARFPADAVDTKNDTWALRAADGPNGTLNVTYGVVRFWKDNDSNQGREEFVRVEGANGSKRFLLNSLSAEYYPNTTTPRLIRSFFWSAKQLENNTVVKNFTKPIYSFELARSFDRDGNLTGIAFSASDDGDRANQDFWLGFPQHDVWSARLDTLEQAGAPTAEGSG